MDSSWGELCVSQNPAGPTDGYGHAWGFRFPSYCPYSTGGSSPGGQAGSPLDMAQLAASPTGIPAPACGWVFVHGFFLDIVPL